MTLLKEVNTPVFKAEGIPVVAEKEYRLRVTGLVGEPAEFSLARIKELPFSRVDARLTSVSGFSVRAPWEGVLWRDFQRELSLEERASHVIFTSLKGYSTCLPLKDLDHPRVLLVYAVDGEAIEREYGWPLRLLVPHRWGYKSCKWLGTITFTAKMEGGFWEDRGYSREGFIEPGLTFDLNTGKHRQIQGGEVIEF